jgi:hypothetical protein
MADLQRLTENAVIAWLAASGTHSQTIGLTGVHAISDDAITLPALVVSCLPQSERFHGTGIYDVQCTITYHWQADDTTDAAASTVWGKIKYVMLWDELRTRLSDLADFTCWGALWDGTETHDIENRHHRQSITLTLIAQPS